MAGNSQKCTPVIRGTQDHGRHFCFLHEDDLLKTPHMRGPNSYCFVAGLFLASVLFVSAAEYKLADGAVINGEAVSGNEVGVILKVDGILGSRTPWTKFSQEALKGFAADPKYRKFVELLIEQPADGTGALDAMQYRPPKPEIVIKEVELPPRIAAGQAGLLAGIGTPLGLFVFLVLFMANVYAGYEVAVYRHHPWKVVCGVSAVAPIVGPVVFLCIPKGAFHEHQAVEAEPAEAATEASSAAPASAHHGAAMPQARLATGTVAASASAEVSAEPPPPPQIPATVYYKRGEFTINKRFLETKFTGFFRLVPGEAERDLQLKFVTANSELVTKRISKVTATDVTLVIQKGEGFVDQTLQLHEIAEIQVRHKDAQD
jgi:hypothetical protein